MALDDQLRELEQRLSALEENATGDGAAFPATYNVTEEGDVESVTFELEAEEEGEETEPEEGELLETSGKGRRKFKKLRKGKGGQVLTVNKETLELEWAEPAGGGGGLSAVSGFVLESGEIQSPGNPLFTCELVEMVEFETLSFHYRIVFSSPFSAKPACFVTPVRINGKEPAAEKFAALASAMNELEAIVKIEGFVGPEEKLAGVKGVFNFLAIGP